MHGIQNGLADGVIKHISINNNVTTAQSEGQWYLWNKTQWTKTKSQREKSPQKIKDLPLNAGKLLSQLTYKGKTYAGCENGLFVQSNKKEWIRELPYDEKYSWALKNVAALTVDSKGRLWFGAKQGIGRKTNDKWQLFTGKENVPYTHFTTAAAGPNGEVWFGTENGAIRAENDYFYYRSNRRWLPDNTVNHIAVAADGTAWIATNKGIAEIISKEMTYEEKAAHFTKQVEERHNRIGFICQSELTEQFNINSSILAISDNDGQYTSMYGAAQAFRYAQTGDKQAKELADRSFYACKWLVDITPDPGFPARVIIPIDWREPVNEQYSRASNLRHQKGDPFWKDIFSSFP